MHYNNIIFPYNLILITSHHLHFKQLQATHFNTHLLCIRPCVLRAVVQKGPVWSNRACHQGAPLTCWTIHRDKSLHRLFGQLNSGHQQLSGTIRGHVQVIDETCDTRLVGGCWDHVSATEEEPVNKSHHWTIVTHFPPSATLCIRGWNQRLLSKTDYKRVYFLWVD